MCKRSIKHSDYSFEEELFAKKTCQETPADSDYYPRITFAPYGFYLCACTADFENRFLFFSRLFRS